MLTHSNPFPLSQATHTPRLYSRRPSPYFPVVTASTISTVPSQAACCVLAASTRRGVWTVAAVTAEVRWCVNVREGVGWFTGSHPGAMPAGHNSLPVSTPKSLPSAPGYARWLDVMRGKRKGDERRMMDSNTWPLEWLSKTYLIDQVTTETTMYFIHE